MACKVEGQCQYKVMSKIKWVNMILSGYCPFQRMFKVRFGKELNEKLVKNLEFL